MKKHLLTKRWAEPLLTSAFWTDLHLIVVTLMNFSLFRRTPYKDFLKLNSQKQNNKSKDSLDSVFSFTSHTYCCSYSNIYPCLELLCHYSFSSLRIHNMLPCRCMLLYQQGSLQFVIREKGCFHCRCLETIRPKERSSFVRGMALRKLISEKYGSYQRGDVHLAAEQDLCIDRAGEGERVFC